MTPNDNTLQKMVLEFIRSCGEQGSTYREAAIKCDLSAPTVAARVHELHKFKLIERSGEKRMTSAGRAAHVWVSV